MQYLLNEEEYQQWQKFKDSQNIEKQVKALRSALEQTYKNLLKSAPPFLPDNRAWAIAILDPIMKEVRELS